MTTLGALLVGLLLVLLLLGVLAWMQRRPRRGPEQPRTVADLVRMREADVPPAPAVVVADEPGFAAADRADDRPEPVEDAPVPASNEESPDVVETPPATWVPDPDAGGEQVAPSVRSTPEDAAVDTPWARALRMAEPWPEWDVDSAAEPEPSADDPPRASLALLPTWHAEPRPRPAAAPAEVAAPPAEVVAAPAEVAAPPAAVVAVPAEVAAPPAASPVECAGPPSPSGPGGADSPTDRHGPLPTPARIAGRVRRPPFATAAEQIAADRALLRTFGVAGPAVAEPEVELEGCATDDDEPAAGTAQPVAFRVVSRDGHGVPGAAVTLLDDHGRETASTRTDPDGHGVLTARHSGGYMLVTAADGYQPGAITVAVTDGPVDADIPLTRSASITGAVGGEDGPIVGAQLVRVQDGEIVDTTQSTDGGAYRFADIAAGEYGLSVSAYECESAAFVLDLADEADLRQDVELVPSGLPADDVMIR